MVEGFAGQNRRRRPPVPSVALTTAHFFGGRRGTGASAALCSGSPLREVVARTKDAVVNISARKFDAEEAAFAKSGKVEKAAQEAREALDGPDAEDLEAARESTGRGKTGKPAD